MSLLSVFVWAVLGPYFQYSENWQLTINTGTTIVTFLMVFIIQNTQNRDGRAIHLKLDALIHANPKASDGLINAQELSDAELEVLYQDAVKLQKRYAERLAKRKAKKAQKP